MGRKFFTHALAVGLALVLQATGALAAPTVTGTTASGYAGDVVHPTVSVFFGGTTLDVDGNPVPFDASQVAAWDFKLSWGDAPLTLDIANSTMTIGTTTYAWANLTGTFLPETVSETGGTSLDNFYALLWADFDTFATVDLTDGFTFNAAFTINPGAAVGIYGIGFAYPEIAFSSSIVDFTGATINYYEVTGLDPMQVTVQATPTTQIPEPGTLSLLGLALAGASLVAARKRRKTLD